MMWFSILSYNIRKYNMNIIRKMYNKLVVIAYQRDVNVLCSKMDFSIVSNHPKLIGLSDDNLKELFDVNLLLQMCISLRLNGDTFDCNKELKLFLNNL